MVLLVDGLGIHALRRNRGCAPFLSEADALPRDVQHVATTFPATTATALASFGTGVPSGEHGIVGTAFRLEGHHGLMLPLHWRDSPNPVSTQPLPTVFERVERAGVDVTSIGPRTHGDSGLTRAALRGGLYVGADTVGQRIAAAQRATATSPSLAYVYWPDLDKAGHLNGPESLAWREDLRVLDLMAQSIAEQLPKDAILVVTADHGMIDTPEEMRFELDDRGELWRDVILLGGEPRARHLYTKPRAAVHVKERWAGVLGDRASVMTRDEVIDAGWFGLVEPWHEDRIGDVVVVSRGPWAFVSTKQDGMLAQLRGQHGAFEPEEVDVPLIVHRT